MDRNVERDSGETMRLSERLASALDVGRIRYCHWKSNEHLQAGLEGKTDLDLLVDREDCATFTKAITELGFKKVISSPETTYIAVENWIGFCERTGILLHLHVHYELVTGMEFVKEYAFPWSRYVLDTVVREESSGFLITNPNVEIILLTLRLAVKAKRTALLFSLLRNVRPYEEPMQRELDYLHERLSFDGLEEALEKMFPKDSSLKDTLQGLVFKKQLDAKALMQLEREIRKELGTSRRYGRLDTARKSLIGNVKLKKNLLLERLGFEVMRRKRFETGGMVIAVIGEEGKERNDLVRNLEKWLRWKMDVHSHGMSRENRKHAVERTREMRLKGGIAFLEGGPEDPETLLKETSRRKNRKTPYNLRVVPDARSREVILQKMLLVFRPDLVIRMTYGGNHLQTVKRVKPVQGTGTMERRTSLGTGDVLEATKVYELDANRPLEEVILDARRIIWQNL